MTRVILNSYFKKSFEECAFRPLKKSLSYFSDFLYILKIRITLSGELHTNVTYKYIRNVSFLSKN